jgi:rod shape-determining protein MreC
MSGFLPRAERRSSVLLGVYAALSLLLLIAGDRIPQGFLRGAGAWVFAPFDRVVLSADRVASAWRENRQLHQRIADLEIENQRLRIAGVENRQLRDSLGLPVPPGMTLRPVEVLALAGDLQPIGATVSGGTRHGVREGDIVVTREGLLGRIGEAWPTQARVVLLTDPNSAVACEIESTSVLGVLKATSSPYPRLVLTGVPLADTVRIGQRVATSGLTARFPRGLPVGRVLRTGRDPSGLTQDVEVAPAAPLSRIRHAFVLVPREAGAAR